MSLQEILFGSFVLPKSTNSLVHRIGFSSSFNYVEPNKRAYSSIQKEREKDPNYKSPSQVKIFDVLSKSTNPISANEMAKKLNMTRNFCNITMATLVKDGFAKRKKMSANGTRYYIYELIKK